MDIFSHKRVLKLNKDDLNEMIDGHGNEDFNQSQNFRHSTFSAKKLMSDDSVMDPSVTNVTIPDATQPSPRLVEVVKAPIADDNSVSVITRPHSAVSNVFNGKTKQK